MHNMKKIYINDEMILASKVKFETMNQEVTNNEIHKITLHIERKLNDKLILSDLMVVLNEKTVLYIPSEKIKIIVTSIFNEIENVGSVNTEQIKVVFEEVSS